jgi:hypothetical protein
MLQPRRLSYRWIAILFIVNTGGLLAYYISDFIFDSKFDMPIPTALLFLVFIYSVGFIFWQLARKPYKYVN